MRRNILFRVGVAVLLILGFWLYQSNLDSKPEAAKPSKTAPKETASQTETRPEPPPPSDSDRNKEQGNQSGSVSGTVRLKSTQAPVAGAMLQIYDTKQKFESPLVSTDEKGSYTLTGLPPSNQLDLYYVEGPSDELYLEGNFVGFSLKPGAQRTGVNMKLSQGQPGTVAGTVVGRKVSWQVPDSLTTATEPKDYERVEDTALAGVKVIVGSLDNGLVKRTETVTDPAGRFRFEKVRPGYYHVWAETPEGAAFVPERDPSRFSHVNLIEQPVREDLQYFFRFDGLSIEGRVTDSQGHPIQGAEIVARYVERYNGNETSSIRKRKYETSKASSNEMGEYRLTNLPASLKFEEALDYLRRGGYSWEFQLQCVSKGYCTGQVALAPFSEGQIQVAFEHEKESLKKHTVESLQRREFRYPDIKLPVGKGNVMTGVDFSLSPDSRISGRVVDTQGNNFLSLEEEKTSATLKNSSTSIALISDKLLQERKKNPFNPEPEPLKVPRGVILGKGSCFKFENVPAGTYRFQITANRLKMHNVETMWITPRSGEVTVHDGETIQDLTVVAESMADRGSITGHVVDAWTGEPVKSLSVRVLQVESSEEPNPQKGFPHARESDEYRDATGPVRSPGDEKLPDGDFTVLNVSPGKVTLALLAPGYQTVQTEVQVSRGQTTEQAFQLGEGGKLSGQVLDAETKEPIKKFEVKITHADGEKKGQPVEGKIQMDKATTGTFCLTGIPTGRVTVEVVENTAPPNSYVKESTHSDTKEEIEIVSGKTTEHTFLLGRKGSLAGRVTVNGEALKEPKSYVELHAYRNGRIEEKSPLFEINAQGGYKSEGINTGTYRVEASLSYSYGYEMGTGVSIRQCAEVQVEPGKETRQDFDFQGTASIQGVFHASDRELFWWLQVVEGSFPEGNWKNPEYQRKTRATIGNLQKGDRYEVRYLSPGTYTLVARCKKRGVENPVSEKRQMVTLTDGQALTVDFDLP